MFIIRDLDLAGRIGSLKLRRGVLETPAFFPVVDVTRQELSLNEIENAGFNQVITNAYLLFKRFGDRVVEKDIHGFLEFNGIVMTDSGAYQILEYGGIDVDQEAIIRYQEAIGSDIGVILDIPTGNVDYEKARYTVKATLRRASEALRLIEGSRVAWVLPVQGGRHLDLVEYSAREASRLPYYSVYAVGSPTEYLERYDIVTVLKMIHSAKRWLPDSKPVHLFGAGHPLIIPYAVALGVDMFDSASYILYARDGRYMVEDGVYRVEDLEYLPCNCPVCSRRTPRDLLEVEERERVRLLALHNLYAIRKSIERVKQAIREGRLWEYLEELSRKHPRAMEAFESLRRFYKYLELRTPQGKGEVYGLKLYGVESLWNPKIMRFKVKALEILDKLMDEVKELKLKPLLSDGECLETEIEREIVYYTPYLGFIPGVLCSVYPTTQHVKPKVFDKRALEDLIYILRVVNVKARNKGVKLVVEYSDRYAWSLEIGKEAEILGLEVRMS